MKLLQDKVAVVTGSSRGIGRAIAEDLASSGANVVVNYRRSQEQAAEVVAHLQQSGVEALAVQADVSDEQQAKQLIDQTLEAFGRIDILVNNAGTTRDGLLLRMRESDWSDVIDTNLKSVYVCSKLALRPMLRQRSGRIINITSLSGLVGMAGQTNYSASKAGIIGFTKALAKEVGSRNITVNAVAPGLFMTDLTADMPEKSVQMAQELAPLGRLGKLIEVAYLVTFLASDKAAYITGEVIRVDGGLGIAS